MSDFQLGYPCAKCGLYGMHHCEGDANLAASDDRTRDFWERCVLALLNESIDTPVSDVADALLVQWRKRFDPREKFSPERESTIRMEATAAERERCLKIAHLHGERVDCSPKSDLESFNQGVRAAMVLIIDRIRGGQ